MNKKISNLRKKIDQIDDQIVSQLMKRMEIVKQLGKLKRELKLETHDTKREIEIIHRLTKLTHGKLSREQITQLFTTIFQFSKQVQE